LVAGLVVHLAVMMEWMMVEQMVVLLVDMSVATTAVRWAVR
jgi:hypothetical protein